MSCSIPSIRIILFEHIMQLKIIIQNKLKSPKSFFLKNVFVFFPEVALFFLHMFCYFLYLVQLHGFSSTWRSTAVIVCVAACMGKEQKSWRYFPPLPLLSSWYEGRVKGWMWQCWFPLPWDMSWCVLTPEAPCASVFQAASPLCCEQKAIRDNLKI